MRKSRSLSIWLVCVWLLCACGSLFAAVQRETFRTDSAYLVIETLRDDLVHIELSATEKGTAPRGALYASPMIYKRDYAGAQSYSRSGVTLQTARLEMRVDTTTLCVAMTDRIKSARLTTICPTALGQDWKGLTLTREGIENLYGLGQQFKHVGSSDGDWVSHGVRDSGDYGNRFEGISLGGMVGNVQIPILYAVGGKSLNYALLLDNVYKQSWNFTGDPWKVEMFGDQIRLYVMAGNTLPDLRRTYMELVGTPPVPPKKAFGLWVSEFGYSSWDRPDELAKGLRAAGFPLEGFVLDLFWFGGVTGGSPDSAMGRLDWDRNKFPDPEANLARLAADDLGLVAIEESYISRNTDTFSQMKDKKLLAFTCGQETPVAIPKQDPNDPRDPWFGDGGMVDWSNPTAGAWVHDNRRFPNLVRKGILGHWTDLGEPERFNPAACYAGVEQTATGVKDRHQDVHNLYSFLWNQSIYDGYYRDRGEINRRPFVLSRSGAAGIERFGTAMWSGDIGSNLDELAAHANAQLHMSMSGIDYYGADAGGFRREAMPCNDKQGHARQYEKELYTQWFANAAWFDVPVRPHTDNTFQQAVQYETAPHLVGDLKSNLANIRQRYELLPYYYSLAHRAYAAGEPLAPPLVFYYQDDPAVRQIGHQKMIGRDLMVGIVARHGEYQRNVYLPDGKWVNYHTNQWFEGQRWLESFPVWIDGVLRLPAFARAGAILPMAYVDERTKDALGHSKDGSSHDELIVKVYAAPGPSSFTLYEDEGSTLQFDANRRPTYTVRTTRISQSKQAGLAQVTIDKAEGAYAGAPAGRDNVVRLVLENAQGLSAKLNGAELPQVNSAAEFEAAPRAWYNAGPNLVVAKSGKQDVSTAKTFQFTIGPVQQTASVFLACDNATTAPGDEIYAVGSVPALGAWKPEAAVKLEPSVYWEYIYNPPPAGQCDPQWRPGPRAPIWTSLVTGLPSAGNLEWKCVRKRQSGALDWQPGMNNLVTLKSGFAGSSRGAF